MKQSYSHLILELIWDYLDPFVLHSFKENLPLKFHYKMYRNLTIVAVLDDFKNDNNSSEREPSSESSNEQSNLSNSSIQGSFYLSFIEDEIVHQEVQFKDIYHYFEAHGKYICQLKVTLNGFHMRYPAIQFMTILWELANKHCSTIPNIVCYGFNESSNKFITSAQSLELTVDPTQTFELPMMKCTRFVLNKEFNDIMGMEKQLIHIIPNLENVNYLDLGSEEPLMFWSSKDYLKFHELLRKSRHLKDLIVSIALYNANVALNLQKIKINKLNIAVKVEDEPTLTIGLLNILNGFDTKSMEIEASTLILKTIPILNNQTWEYLKFQNLDENEILHLKMLECHITKLCYFSWIPVVPVIPKNCKHCLVSFLVMIPDDPKIDGYNLEIKRTFENVYEYEYLKMQ